MPNTSIESAIVSRWNAVDFDTSIALLYPGEDAPTPETTITSPTSLGMPRASYMLFDEEVDVWSRGSIVITQEVRIEIWMTSRPNVRAALLQIQQAFNNAEIATTDPMTLDSSYGTIIGVMQQPGGQNIVKEDDAVFHGYAAFEVRWVKVNSVPS